ncbi:MAG: hypothetical protein OEY56_06290 [Cyclobacteriaceae bacterium]|nr:hypothetical protein [Cyclobacteriaceae bacterium]
MKNLRIICLIVLGWGISTSLFAQENLTDKLKLMSDNDLLVIRKPIYEYLYTWNHSSPLLDVAKNELNAKIKENRQKGKDPYKGTERLKEAYEEVVTADGEQRSFIAQTYALPMLMELREKGVDLEPSDIYTAQYVIKYALGVPRFNRGELDIDNLDQMEKEINELIRTYPNNYAEKLEGEGGIINIFRTNALSYYNVFVEMNRAAYLKETEGYAGNSGGGKNLNQMNCGEKAEYLRKAGIINY